MGEVGIRGVDAGMRIRLRLSKVVITCVSQVVLMVGVGRGVGEVAGMVRMRGGPSSIL